MRPKRAHGPHVDDDSEWYVVDDAECPGLGLVELVCTALYAIPRTAVLGAVLLTAYLGGAIATQLRIEAGLSPVVFPAILGALLWGGLALRDPRVRALISARDA